MPTEVKTATVKTSLRLRQDLWKRTRILAIEERSELQIIVNRALEEYLIRSGARGEEVIGGSSERRRSR